MATAFLRALYDLDTLDSRFTSFPVSYRPLSGRDVDADAKARAEDTHAQQHVRYLAKPSRWRSYEFYFYYFVIAVAVPYMFWVVYGISTPSDPRYSKYEHLLSPGWVPGRKIDVSDSQYHAFRSNLPYVVLLLALHPICRRLWDASSLTVTNVATSTEKTQQGTARFERRASFDFAFAIFYLAALHGFSALKILLILVINYYIATALPSRYVPAATWGFNICVLFANELCHGYRFADIARLLWPRQPSGYSFDTFPVRTGVWLDSHGGLIARWEVLFNITILRLISFNMDYYWSHDRTHASSIELDIANLTEQDRIKIPSPPEAYSFRTYVSFALYAPLYLAGPILTFNDYVAQLRFRPASVETRRTVMYAIRFALALLAMELVLHFNYLCAISLARPDWSDYTPAQLSISSLLHLHLIWLKLLLPWRLFRLWALVDGIDPPENLLRCVSNSYSTRSFWRSWHRSYNRWLIRYLYVPLGGASFVSVQSTARTILTYVVVFTFVALWHDIKLRLLAWGWLVVLFMLPELSAAVLFPPREWYRYPTTYRLMCGAGGVLNLLMMLMANLVGFSVGLDGLATIIAAIFRDWSGAVFLLFSCSALFVGVQTMFEIREAERRRGIHLKC